jgi:Family of unknown function (DUF5320)
MPGFNGTGPRGEGPMTGGNRGRCNPTDGDSQPGRSYGLGRGGMACGCGRGRGGSRGGFGPARTYAPANVDEERQYLTEQLSALEGEINDIRARMEQLNDDKK